MPRTCSRLNTAALAPIALMNRKIAKTVKRLQRKIVKFTELEMYVRDDIVRKKIHIFKQQRHLTKKTMYNEDQYDGFQYESRSLVDLKDGTERIITTDDVAG
jgi:hypothetical protein